MRKYIIQQENGIEVTKKFRSDKEAVAFIEDPKNLRTIGYMNLSYKDNNGNWMSWDRTCRMWTQK